ncbi:MAG: hypothetical protein ACKV2T_41895 [Kofleriaceae bacterium]
MTRDKHGRALIAVLGFLVAILLATVRPGLFSIDESSYIATITGLRDGGLAIAASERLAPSPALYAFDAAPRSRPTKVPVTSSSPPLFAPIALPFSYGGVRGLMALQILSFAACAGLVFSFVRRHTHRVDLAWLAFGTFVVGSFALEYAQAVWPHALAMALVMGAFDLASRVRTGGSAWLAAGAGACVAIAAGLRYQNTVLVATIGAGLLLVNAAGRPRLRVALLAFALGAAPIILVSSAMNYTRHGSWNPTSKGSGYLKIVYKNTEGSHLVTQAITSTWSRVVDYSTWPTNPTGMIADASGAMVLDGRFKKALLQSSPWAIIPLLAMLLALRKREDESSELRRELLAAGLVVAGTIGMFAIYGHRRDDGWSFNQRYFLELMPLLVAGLAISLTRVTLSWRALAVGAAVAFAAAMAVLLLDSQATWRSFVVMRIPIVLALVVAALWFFARESPHPRAVGAVVGAALGWAAAMQLGNDLPGARGRRAFNAEQLATMESVLPREPSALFVYWGAKDPYGALPLDHDVIVVDPWIDDGMTARVVVDSALASGRRVFTLAMPTPTLQAMTANLRVARVPGPVRLLEIQR